MNNPIKHPARFNFLHFVSIVAILAILGLTVWQLNSNYSVESDLASPAARQSAEAVPEVKSSRDMSAIGNYLEDIYVDKELDTREIDSALSE